MKLANDHYKACGDKNYGHCAQYLPMFIFGVEMSLFIDFSLVWGGGGGNGRFSHIGAVD